LIITNKAERWFLLIWLLVTAWMFLCAFMVQGEYGDGYQTIVNARYLFGESPNYFVQRGPLAAIALWPVELVVQSMALDPIDVRPYHFLSGALHSAYLFICWLLLRRAPGSVVAKLIAFCAAFLSVIFYAYAPFLSHDLLPGLLFLLLIFLCHRWLELRNTRDVIYLVLLGAAVTLVKQTYAIFWISIIFYASLAWILKWDSARITFRRLSELGAIALGSALISWFGYAWFIGGELPDDSIFTRPLSLITAISAQYGNDMAGMFATDLYLRNLSNYGIAALLLVLPGLVLAFRCSDGRMRQIAICWLVSVCIMQFIGFREARYLAFLAPLTAMLIVPVIQHLLKRQLAIAVVFLLIVFDQSRGLRTAIAPLASASKVDVARFVNSPDSDGPIVASQVLSFAYAATSPLARDRYHGIYHLTPELLSGLYQGRIAVGNISDPRELGRSQIAPGYRVYFSNDTLLRHPPWSDENAPAGLANFLLVAGDAVNLELVRDGQAYQRVENDGSYVMYMPAEGIDEQMPVITANELSITAANNLYGGSVEDRIHVLAVVITALCQADSCSYR
jgi:hypothetical protein